jgi:hypothetical protein
MFSIYSFWGDSVVAIAALYGLGSFGSKHGRCGRSSPHPSRLAVLFTVARTIHRLRLKCDGTRAETRFRLSAKRTSPFKSAGEGGGTGDQFSRLLAAEVVPSAVVMLDAPCSEVVWRVLATHSIRQFPLHFPSRASPCAISFQLDSTLAPLRR